MSIEVYARSVNESDANLLATVASVGELKELVAHMKLCGVACDGDVHRDLTIQYVVDDESAYVEIIVG